MAGVGLRTFSADSAYSVTTCFGNYARLWDSSNCEIVRQYSGHHKGAVCVALDDVRGGRTEHKREIFQPGNEVNYKATKLVQL